jgi:16S rRNA (guanine966-N2)-methyltransferase
VVFLDPPYREYEIHAPEVNRMLARLVEKMPPGSAVVLESWRDLDERILPEFASWDIRRYGSSQVALKIVADKPKAGNDLDPSAQPTGRDDVLAGPDSEDGPDD